VTEVFSTIGDRGEVITHFLPETIGFEQGERFNTCHVRAKA